MQGRNYSAVVVRIKQRRNGKYLSNRSQSPSYAIIEKLGSGRIEPNRTQSESWLTARSVRTGGVDGAPLAALLAALAGPAPVLHHHRDPARPPRHRPRLSSPRSIPRGAQQIPSEYRKLALDRSLGANQIAMWGIFWEPYFL